MTPPLQSASTIPAASALPVAVTGRGEKLQRFAWDGFSFQVPVGWDLARYAHERDTGRLALEDEAGLRLEMDWVRAPRPVLAERLKKKREELERAMRAREADVERVAGLPPDWQADLFTLPDGRRLLLAYVRRAPDPFFGFLKVFWDKISRRVPLRTIRVLAESFQQPREDLVPWEVYDIAFRMDRRYRLIQTSFQAGSKLMVFEWRRRRVFLWFCSLADVALKTQSIETWAVGVLNGFKPLRHRRFVAVGPGRIEAQKKKIHPLGHGEDISRWCFRYHVQCRHLAADNRLFLSVFHHRSPADVADLRRAFP